MRNLILILALLFAFAVPGMAEIQVDGVTKDPPGGDGGGGGVANPMTANLDAGGFDITDIGNVQADTVSLVNGATHSANEGMYASGTSTRIKQAGFDILGVTGSGETGIFTWSQGTIGWSNSTTNVNTLLGGFHFDDVDTVNLGTAEGTADWNLEVASLEVANNLTSSVANAGFRFLSSGRMYYGTSSANSSFMIQFITNPRINTTSDGVYGFTSSATSPDGVPDTGICRNAAGVMMVNDGAGCVVGTDEGDLIAGVIQFNNSGAGAPTGTDCDADDERGKLYIDTTNNRLYVCNGATRGWDYTALTD